MRPPVRIPAQQPFTLSFSGRRPIFLPGLVGISALPKGRASFTAAPSASTFGAWVWTWRRGWTCRHTLRGLARSRTAGRPRAERPSAARESRTTSEGSGSRMARGSRDTPEPVASHPRTRDIPEYWRSRIWSALAIVKKPAPSLPTYGGGGSRRPPVHRSAAAAPGLDPTGTRQQSSRLQDQDGRSCRAS
jgi:hypothetical protein